MNRTVTPASAETVLKRGLWDPKARWFAFQDEKGHKDLRYTVQIFKLFNSKVLDAEEEAAEAPVVALF